jgi:hypothetical protein
LMVESSRIHSLVLLPSFSVLTLHAPAVVLGPLFLYRLKEQSECYDKQVVIVMI